MLACAAQAYRTSRNRPSRAGSGGTAVNAAQCNFDGVDDAQVSRTAAEIAAELDTNAATVSMRQPRDNVIGGGQHPRRAEAALQCVTLGEALPDHVHHHVSLVTFDSANLATVGGGSERDTG